MFKMEVVSKQTTHVRAVSTRLEWVIDHFGKLMRLFKNSASLVSKQFGSPLVSTVAWELHIYPNGKREEDSGNVSFFLRQIGLQRGEEAIMTDFKIQAIDPSGGVTSVCRDVKDFTHQQGRGKFQVPREKLKDTLHPDGSLHLTCEVEFFPPGAKLTAEADEDIKNDRSDLDLRELLETELFSDVSIKVGSKSFRAHRNILGLHSQVFRSMFLQENMVEAQKGVINITDSHPDPVFSMLEFMYTGTTIGIERYPEDVLALAEKYAILKLKDLCENRLAKTLSQKNICEVVQFADTYNASFLKNACVQFLSTHHKAILKGDAWRRLKKEQADLANELLELVLSGEGANCGTLDSSLLRGGSPLGSNNSLCGGSMMISSAGGNLLKNSGGGGSSSSSLYSLASSPPSSNQCGSNSSYHNNATTPQSLPIVYHTHSNINNNTSQSQQPSAHSQQTSHSIHNLHHQHSSTTPTNSTIGPIGSSTSSSSSTTSISSSLSSSAQSTSNSTNNSNSPSSTASSSSLGGGITGPTSGLPSSSSSEQQRTTNNDNDYNRNESQQQQQQRPDLSDSPSDDPRFGNDSTGNGHSGGSSKGPVRKRPRRKM